MKLASGLAARRALVTAFSVGIVVFVFIAVLATRGQAPIQGAMSPLLGKPAPPITGTDILTGKKVSLASLHGRFVVVNFFMSTCVPCQQEAPDLEAFTYTHRSDATVLGVIYNDSVPNSVKFFAQYGSTWSAVADPNASIAVSYGVSSPPRSFVVSPAGEVIAYFPGQVTEAALNVAITADGNGTT